MHKILEDCCEIEVYREHYKKEAENYDLKVENILIRERVFRKVQNEVQIRIKKGYQGLEKINVKEYIRKYLGD